MPRRSDPTRSAAGTEASAGTPTTFVDLTDLLAFLTAHSVVSGIQRVLVEVLPHLVNPMSCQFVCLDDSRGVMVVLDQGPVAGVLQDLRDAAHDPDELKLAAREQWLTRGTRPEAVARPGDVLAVLGAAWMFPGLFKGIRRLKQAGASVVVLLYDLIPLVMPGLPPDAVARFSDYLPRVAAIADRAPAISAATRRDFIEYCSSRGWRVPPGGVTRLAANQWNSDGSGALVIEPDKAWPRPFVLFVSTIEVRKNHILALRAWERLIDRHGTQTVPDLVCVGRLGWNAFEFLERHRVTGGLGGRIHLLTDSLPDARLAALYRDCEFSIFPSRYEGWGLPVGESLEMGRPVIAAANSSIPEAGGDFARYFPDGDIEALVSELERYVLDPSALHEDAENIAHHYRPPTWQDVAVVIGAEVQLARSGYQPLDERLVLDHEYGVGPLAHYDGGSAGEDFLTFLDDARRLPLTGQYLDSDRQLQGELLADWSRGEVDTVDIQFRRPTPEPIHLVACIPLRRRGLPVRIQWPHGEVVLPLDAHGVVRLELGPGPVNEVVEVRLQTRRHPVLRRPAIRSFVVTADLSEVGRLAEHGPAAPVGLGDLAPVRRGRRLTKKALGRAQRTIRNRMA